MTTAYIALGSNLGKRQIALRAALRRLADLPKTRVIATATFRETEPVDAPADSPAFLNSAAAIETELSPQALMASLLTIEHELGRTRNEQRNSPRTIDLDLLLFGNLVLQEESLRVPHPKMTHRQFVLEPLAEIAPDIVHPVNGKTIRQLLDELRAATPSTNVVKNATILRAK